MDNDNIEEEVVIENVDEQEIDKSTEQEIDWKAKYEAEEGRRRRLETKLAKQSESPKEPAQKSTDLDFGAKAYLVANGVKGSDEVKLVKEIMANTGKDLDAVLESKYFQAELKELRELRASAEATPSGSKRSTQSASNTVDYWLAKGELPPVSEVELRRKVVNARIAKESNTNVFYNR